MKNRLMNIKYWHILIFVGFSITLGVGMLILFEDWLVSPILIVFGLEVFIIDLFRRLILSKSSTKFTGAVIFIFSILNFVRHQWFFVFISDEKNIVNIDSESAWFLVRELFWLGLATWVLVKAICLFREDKEFEMVVKTKGFKRLIFSILFLLLVELPFFGIHGGFGGELHGHGFWDLGMHIH